MKKFNIPQLPEVIRFQLLPCPFSLFAYLENYFCPDFHGSDCQSVVIIHRSDFIRL